MDNPRIGSLNSLADYGLGSDIEDSDEEVENKDNQVKSIAETRPYVAQGRVTSSKLSVVYVVKGLFLYAYGDGFQERSRSPRDTMYIQFLNYTVSR